MAENNTTSIKEELILKIRTLDIKEIYSLESSIEEIINEKKHEAKKKRFEALGKPNKSCFTCYYGDITEIDEEIHLFWCQVYNSELYKEDCIDHLTEEEKMEKHKQFYDEIFRAK